MSLNLNEISKFFETEYPLNHEGLSELLSLFKVRSFEKGTQILSSGGFEKELRFLNRGVIREYYSSLEKEVNINFYCKPQFVSDLSSFINGRETKKNQECLSETEILTIDREEFHQLLEKYQCGKKFIDLSFQRLLKHKELLEYNRITKSADDLYKELMIYKPEWLERIPQYHIASYLEITPETLSRIRKRIS